MTPVIPGKAYLLRTVGGKEVEFTFYHKTEAGVTIDGVTSEEVMAMLIDRHRGFLDRVDTTENINIWTMLKQALAWMNQRRVKKYIRKNRIKQL